jgi:hypothetical protein
LVRSYGFSNTGLSTQLSQRSFCRCRRTVERIL